MNQDILVTEFEGFRSQLKSFILRFTANATYTEDLVQDTYIKASENLYSFKDESSLKTWVFSIALNLAKDFLKSKRRWPENASDICKEAALGNQRFFQESMQIRQTSPHGNFEIKEHINLCFICVSKSLPIEQQIVILLKEVYEFKVKEIASIINQTDAMVKYYLHVGRTKLVTVFENKCTLISKKGACHQCTELNGIYNPKQDAMVEAQKIQLVKESNNPDKEILLDLRMKIIKEINPFDSPAHELQLHHLEHNRIVIENNAEES